MAYPIEVRRAAVAAHKKLGSSKEVAELLGCSESWVRRVVQQLRETGSLQIQAPYRPDNRKLDAQGLEELRRLIDRTPDMTLRELAAALTRKVSVPTVWRATQALGLPLKKKTQHAAEQDRHDVKEARAAWFTHFEDTKLDQLVFVDEFGATTNMTRARARGPRGKRVVCKTPHGHWKVLSTIAAMTVGGMLTCGTFDGATDTEIFNAFLREGLVPLLKPGQVVVLDNLSVHRNPKVDQLIQSAGARVLRLPPYSPDLNPIEMAFSKVKTLLRSQGRRTVEGLLEAISIATASITNSDALSYMRHCGYHATAA